VLFAAGMALALLSLAVAGAMYDVRYSLPALPLLGIGAVLAAEQLIGRP
jgi:hypothetical protein